MTTQSSLERFRVRITHKPTGITVTRTGQYFRTERAAYNDAMHYLRSRLAMMGYAPSMIRIEDIKEQPHDSE